MAVLKIELNTPDINDDLPVYLVGTFNQWQPADEGFRMKKIEAGHYSFDFNEFPELPLEYKYTRGGWDTVELDKDGEHTPNRKVTKTKSKIKDTVHQWDYFKKPYQEKLLPIIKVISEQFEMPQLIKTRRIAALLPHDYYDSDKSYPVLYLQDGQNLFDEYAPYGNWALDKQLAILTEQNKHEIIVIAIDHGERERIAEYSPSHHKKLGKGTGKKYVQFLSQTLKKYIDDNFRTLTDRMHTGIGGSSMGGLISMYAGLKYPEVFGKLMIFSPSLWVDRDIALRADRYFAQFETRIYIYGGEQESPTMIPHIQAFKSALLKNRIDDTKIQFHISINPSGGHNEEEWGNEFPKAINWLFHKNS